MEFLHSSSYQENMHSTNTYSLDEFNEVDDVFYSELKRQILQLTAEDDGDGDVSNENRNPIKVVEGRKGFTNNGPCMQRRCYYNWHGNDDLAAPTWMLNLWRRGNGTGVFIPQAVHCRRKNRTSMCLRLYG